MSLPLEESASNGRRNYDDGKQDSRNAALTEYYTEEASDESGASFATFSNDYATIRNFMKEGDSKTDTVDGKLTKDYIEMLDYENRHIALGRR